MNSRAVEPVTTIEEPIDIGRIIGLIGPTGALRPGWSTGWTAAQQRIIHSIYMNLPEDMFRNAVELARAADENWRRKVPKLEPVRWTEAEHAEKATCLTWEQQKNLWDHMDAGNGFLSGQMTLAQYEKLIAYMEPLPSLGEMLALFHVARAKARVHKMPPKPGTKEPPIEERPKPLSAAQVAAVQAQVDALRASHPNATAGQVLAMLEGAR